MERRYVIFKWSKAFSKGDEWKNAERLLKEEEEREIKLKKKKVNQRW